MSIGAARDLTGASGAQATTTAETTSTTAGWAGWSPLPSYTSTTNAPATVNYQGKHYVFTRGTDNRIHHNIFDGYFWTGWSQVPSAGLTTAAPAAVEYSGQLYLITVGTNERIYRNAFNGTYWTGTAEIAGDGHTSAAPVAVTYNGQLRSRSPTAASCTCSSAAPAGASTATSATTAPGEGGPRSLAVSGPPRGWAPPSTGAPSTCSRGTDDRIYRNRFDYGYWIGWAEVKGGGRTMSTPTPVVHNGELYVFTRGWDDRVYRNRYNGYGTSWTGWWEVPGPGPAPRWHHQLRRRPAHVHPRH